MKRESRYVKVARRMYEKAKQVLPTYTHRNSPKSYTFPQLAACVMMKFYLNLSYRDTEEWLLATDQVCEVLELSEVPDHSTLSRAFRKLHKPLLDEMNRQLLDEQELEEEAIAEDSTSFSLSQAGSYYRTRSGKTFSDWVKGGYAVGKDSQLMVGWCAQAGRLPDFGLRKPLKRQARRYGKYVKRRRAWFFLADKGFDSQDITDNDLIPPIRRYGKVSAQRQARADLLSQSRLDGIYGYRWIVEIVNSVIKRKFGDSVCSRLWFLQRRETIIKGFIYNIHRIVTILLSLFHHTLKQSNYKLITEFKNILSAHG